jgi:hypothetical protein
MAKELETRMRNILAAVAAMGIMFQVSVPGQTTNPPSPETVGSQLNSYWVSNQLSQIEAYVTDLSTNYPNYVPAILAKACFEGVFRNNLSNVIAELHRVEQANVGSDRFRALVSAEKTQIQLLLEFYYSEGTSHADLTNAANPQAVRDGVPEWPYLEIITNAPSVNLP